MTEPSEQAVRRAVAALLPFVRAYRLPLNPQELEEITCAVLRQTGSAATLAEVSEAVESQIAESVAAHQRMLAGMQAQASAGWADQLCRLPLIFRGGGGAVGSLFSAAAPRRSTILVRRYLSRCARITAL